ncbi:MAG: amidohydrolase family protein [Bryobacterales bacterium]|nr:amidohydrolase family protein [Bryobacterales bacterium]
MKFSLLLPGLFALLLPSPAGAASTKAFAGARIFDGTGRAVIENGVIVVQDGRITAIGPSNKVRPPKGAQTINVSGKTITPGLINSHGHVSDVEGKGTGATEEGVRQQLALFSRYGITTVVSLGGEEQAAFRVRDAQETPALSHARIYLAGTVIVAKTSEEGRRMVDTVAATKPNFIKIRVDDNLGTTRKIPPNVYRAVIDEAHKQRLPLAVHFFYLDDAKDLVRSGADILAHSVRDKPVDDEFLSLVKSRNIPYCPTLTRELSTFVYEDIPAFFTDPFFLREARPQVIAALKDSARQQAMRVNKMSQAYKAALPTAKSNLKKLADAGVPILMGTDSGATAARFEGYFEHLEMRMMADAGMSPGEILLSATGVPARALKLKDIGTLEKGKWADLVVYDRNPLEEIENTKTITAVYIAGNEVKR